MDDLLELVLAAKQKQDIEKIISCNEKTEKYGLTLTQDEADQLMAGRKENLKANQRVEFGEGILPQLIYAFCDSDYIMQDSYKDTLMQLQDIFYLYKNESMDQLTDEELINFMRTQFDDICFGDLDYLQGTCLERFARGVREGYRCEMQQKERDEYGLRNDNRDYEKFTEEVRWEYEVYKQKLDDLN